MTYIRTEKYNRPHKRLRRAQFLCRHQKQIKSNVYKLCEITRSFAPTVLIYAKCTRKSTTSEQPYSEGQKEKELSDKYYTENYNLSNTYSTISTEIFWYGIPRHDGDRQTFRERERELNNGNDDSSYPSLLTDLQIDFR